jgi:hypothetical protein
MKKIIVILSATLLLIVGCASFTVSENSACDTQAASFPLPELSSLGSALPAGVPSYVSDFDASGYDAGAYLAMVPDAGNLAFTLPPFSKSTSFDFSSTLNDITDVTPNITVVLNSLVLDNQQGEFDWLTNVSVTLDSQGLPTLELAEYAPTSLPGATINLATALTPQATPALLLTYFENGPVTLTVTVGGTKGTVVNEATVKMLQGLNGQLNTNVTTCISASASLSKSL